MGHQPSSTPSIRDWLNSALSDEPFIYSRNSENRVPNNNRLYTSFAESIQVQEWHEAYLLPDLAHLIAEPDRPMRNGLAASKPVVLDAFRVLSVEANLQDFFNLSLVYCVNLALHCIYQLPVVILPHVPFTRDTPDSIQASASFTPDYTVFKGDVAQNPALLADHGASLIVGDVKLYCGTKPQVEHTERLRLSDLGQLLWYCVCRKTRFAFCVSDIELVVLEFSMDRSGNIASLDKVVARAETEMSSPVQEIPIRGKTAPSKRRVSNSTTDSAVSPGDRHRHKRGGIIPEVVEDDALVSSSPELPSSIPERPSPRTPEHEPAHPYSSDSFVPSTPGGISAETLRDLSFEGRHVIARLCSFPIQQFAPALFGFITLAKLVDEKGENHISAKQVNLQDYSI